MGAGGAVRLHRGRRAQSGLERDLSRADGLKHGAGVRENTGSGAEAYAEVSEPAARPYREGDLPGWE